MTNPAVCKPCLAGIHSCCRLRIPLASGDGYTLCACQTAACTAHREAAAHA